MKTSRRCLFSVLLLAGSAPVLASGPLGVCAVIERVAFEPNAGSPERIQVFGAFAFYEGAVSQPLGFTAPARGYMYFKLPSRYAADQVRREWADLASVAGTGEAVAFGRFGFVGLIGRVSPDDPDGVGSSGGYALGVGKGVQPLGQKPSEPAEYLPAETGVARLGTGNYDDLVAELKALLDE